MMKRAQKDTNIRLQINEFEMKELKLLLAATTPYFKYAMLCYKYATNQMIESNSSAPQTINVVNLPLEIRESIALTCPWPVCGQSIDPKLLAR